MGEWWVPRLQRHPPHGLERRLACAPSRTTIRASRAPKCGIADRAIATYTPGAWALVLAEGPINDQANMQYGAVANGPATTAETLRAFLAHVTAGASYAADSSRFAYRGAGVAGGLTNTVGESVDAAFTGDSATS